MSKSTGGAAFADCREGDVGVAEVAESALSMLDGGLEVEAAHGERLKNINNRIWPSPASLSGPSSSRVCGEGPCFGPVLSSVCGRLSLRWVVFPVFRVHVAVAFSRTDLRDAARALRRATVPLQSGGETREAEELLSGWLLGAGRSYDSLLLAAQRDADIANEVLVQSW